MPNGNYAPHQQQQQSYGGIDQNSYAYQTNTTTSQQLPTSTSPSNATPQPEIPKDEVGWYFVEQYYTTLSRSPEKLYLFYNKRSQSVSGQETDKVAVCVGQRAINDKIKELDFHDCKVRVTNVDSQSSDSNIVIQVIGELINRSQPHRKFTQTFVLATQTNGYFVLNDIFRYLVEEEDEPEADVQQPADEVQQAPSTESPAAEKSAPVDSEAKTLPSSAEPAEIDKAAEDGDQKIEGKLVNGTHADEVPGPAEKGEETAVEEPKVAEEIPIAEPEAAKEPGAAPLEKTSTDEVDKEEEIPKDPEPTRVATPPAKEAARAPVPASKPAAPAVPKTWASLAASAAKTTASAASSVAQPAAPAAARAVQKVASAVQAPSTTSSAPPPPSAPAAQRDDARGSNSQDEWTAVSGSHNRQQSRQANHVSQQEVQLYRGYIKNIQDNVDAAKLRAELEKFGELAYFDIARQKV